MKIARSIAVVLGLCVLGSLLPVIFFWAGAKALGLRPLDISERVRIVNPQYLYHGDVQVFCRYGRFQPRTQKQVVVFGGSSAHGYRLKQGEDFLSVLGRKLKTKAGDTWGTQNQAISGKDSFYVKACMSQFQEGQADWIVYEGHNDFINLYGSAGTKRFLYENPLATRFLEKLLESGASGWLRVFFPQGDAPVSGARHRELAEKVLRVSEANYRDMHAIAKQKGARLVLTTVISGLAFPPSSASREATDAFLGAEAAFAAGKKDEALALYRIARDLDPSMQRAPSSFNEMLRGLAKEFAGEVLLVDLERDFESAFSREKIGCNLFGEGEHCDRLHPNARAHAWIAGKLERALLQP